jgi:hypothetical protein
MLEEPFETPLVSPSLSETMTNNSLSSVPQQVQHSQIRERAPLSTSIDTGIWLPILVKLCHGKQALTRNV